MVDKFYLSQARYDELTKESETLKGQTRQEIAERLKRAKEFGDLSENSEYTEARDEQSRVESRIYELEEILRNTAIIQKGGGDKVEIGSTVTAERNDGKSFTYQIVGSNEANPSEGKISNESPLGKVFLGKGVGEKAVAQTPGGAATYQIVKIE